MDATIRDGELLKSRLPPLLSVVAGMVDVIGYLDFKLFTAHVTGNLVIIASFLVRGGPPNLDQVLAVPVFVLAVAGVWSYSKVLRRRGPSLARPLLLFQFVLLACVCVIAVVGHPVANPRGGTANLAGMVAVSAMACQFALFRLAVPGAPSTAVMTGNITVTVLSFLDKVSQGEPLVASAEERLKNAAYILMGFFAGCVAGAAGFSQWGEWAWVLPVAATGMTMLVVPRPKRNFATRK